MARAQAVNGLNVEKRLLMYNELKKERLRHGTLT
jgi:hypothetical protein